MHSSQDAAKENKTRLSRLNDGLIVNQKTAKVCQSKLRLV